MSRLRSTKKVPYSERREHADAVIKKIEEHAPDMVFRSPIKGDPRVFMRFDVDDEKYGRKSYVFYTGVDVKGEGVFIHRGQEGGGHSYESARLVHRARVKDPKKLELNIVRTKVEESIGLNQRLQTIALTAVNENEVLRLTGGEFIDALTSASSLLAGDHETPLIK